MNTNPVAQAGVKEISAPAFLVTAGFNGHRQLIPREGDVRTFDAIPDAQALHGPRVLFAGWSSTVIVCGKILFGLGHPQMEHSTDDRHERLHSGFGDHNGMSGCLDDEGRLYVVRPAVGALATCVLSCQSKENSPLISNIALASSGRLALSFMQARNGRLCHLAEFESFEVFLRWFENPSSEGNYPGAHHMLPGQPKQLVANIATFTLLMRDGQVYTWGDARYQSLGRPVTNESSSSTNEPQILEALGGLRISKVSVGGWMSAALSLDGAVYVWGIMTPTTDGIIEPLGAVESGQVSLVEVRRSGSEPFDFTDVAVGDNHLAVVTECGRVLVVGDNRNGQLGIGRQDAFMPTWQEAIDASAAQNVFCGPKSTFVSKRE